jgi:hypothetical protein
MPNDTVDDILDTPQTSEALVLIEGQRIRTAGTSYKVQEETSLFVNLVEVKAQTNRHLKIACDNDTCIAARSAHGKHPYSLRGTRETFQDGLPRCGACDGALVGGAFRTMQPVGWALQAPPEVETEQS